MSFIQDYQEYTDPLEVPEIFHFWCAMSALAACAQRKIWIDMGLFKVIPNLYIILTSEPGKCGKSTAMNLVREAIENIKDVHTKSDSITKEKIFDSMVQGAKTYAFPKSTMIHSSLTIFANEMSLLIKKGDKDFVSSLNSLFDALTIFKNSTKGKGENIVINPFLNILGGTTPDWIAANIQDDLLEGGFSARALFVYSDTPKKLNPFPEPTEGGKLAYERVIARLDKVTQIGGCFVMSKDCRSFYSEWYMAHHSAKVKNPRMAGYHYRKRIHLIKTAMLCSLAEKDELILEVSNMNAALTMLNMTEPLIERSIVSVGRNELNPICMDILEKLKARKTMTMKQIYIENSFRLSHPEFEEVIKMLLTMKKIDIVTEGTIATVKYVGE